MSPRKVFPEAQYVYEETDSEYSGTITDAISGVLLDQSNIATLLVTIYAKKDPRIALRPKQDVRNGGAWNRGVTVVAGVIKMALYPLDNRVSAGSTEGKSELHIILIEGTTTGSPSRAFKHEIEYPVMDLANTMSGPTFISESVLFVLSGNNVNLIKTP